MLGNGPRKLDVGKFLRSECANVDALVPLVRQSGGIGRRAFANAQPAQVILAWVAATVGLKDLKNVEVC